jgi:hypothetical protein
MPGSGKVEAVKIHYSAPSRKKAVHKLLPGIFISVDFRQSPQLEIRTEDTVDARGGPFEFARFAITPLEHVAGFRSCLLQEDYFD